MADAEGFKNSCRLYKERSQDYKQRITLSMVMKNEASRYLRDVLEDARRYITDAVIIDDASTDNSVAMCEEILKGIPLVIIKNQESKFTNEITLRQQQWNETVKTNPDWIVFLDADEIFERSFADGVRDLIATESVDAYYFRLYDMWDETHYRDDGYWYAHNHYRPFLIRYRPDIPYMWNNANAQHCGRMPSIVMKLLGNTVQYRLKHYGWAKLEDRQAKVRRYQELDPDAKFGIKAQYDSILDEHPNLVGWIE